MRIRSVMAMVGALVLAVPALADETPKKAYCLVCSAHGETEEEDVKGTAEYDGVTYYFCAKDCVEKFNKHALWYIPQPIPRPAPEFSAVSLDGAEVRSEFKGNVTLVDFWATWCKPCQKSMPEIQALYERYGDKGFRVLGLSLDDTDDRVKRIRKMVDKYDITYPVYLDASDKPAWITYRVPTVPAMFLVDRDGQVVAEWKGSVDHDALAQRVAALVGDSGTAD